MKTSASLWRIVDANANRCREAMRVIEEVARFVLNDQGLMKRLKGARHHFTAILSELQRKGRCKILLYSRESASDVGVLVSLVSERKRRDLLDVVEANFKRAQEGLRVLEEFSKLVEPRVSDGFKALRYRIYTLEKEMHCALVKKKKRAGNPARSPKR